jgi:hypothetical protein
MGTGLKVKVCQILVGHSNFRCKLFEIINEINPMPERNLAGEKPPGCLAGAMEPTARK